MAPRCMSKILVHGSCKRYCLASFLIHIYEVYVSDFIMGFSRDSLVRMSVSKTLFDCAGSVKEFVITISGNHVTK